MLKLGAFFLRKEENLEPRHCVVEKVIPLTGTEFDRFASHMVTRDWDFIKENSDLMLVDRAGTYHCILVIGEDRENGILVESEGASYARYAAHVPHVHTILEANLYPSLAGYTRRLAAMVDHIVGEVQKLQPGETHASVSFDELEQLSGIDLEAESSVLSALDGMMYDRPEIGTVELNDNGYVVTAAPAMAGPEQGPGQEQELKM